MNNLPLAAATAVFLLFTSSAFAETRTLDVDPFHAVEITSGITADISVGGAQSVVADSPTSGDFDQFRYEVRAGVLHIWYDWSLLRLFDFADRNLKLTIAVPSLDAMTVTSGANAKAAGLAGDSLKLELTSGASASAYGVAAKSYDIAVTSGAHLDMDGTCGTAKIEVTTGASFTAQKLVCDDVVASATTGASLAVTANQTIGGEVTTGASLTVYGTPAVKSLETTTGGSLNFPN
jgi:hypothetical protein